MIKQIGVMVRKQRKEVGLSQRMLCRGLCSTSELSKLESGERELDSFTLGALVQRLGKSMNQFEVLVSEDEYQLILARAVIQEALRTSRLEEAKTWLETYRHSTEHLKKDLHKQYILMIEAMIEYLKDKNVQACLKKMQIAAELSFTEKEELIWEKGCLCLQEMQVLLVISYLLMEGDKQSEAEALLLKMLKCIEEKYTSEAAKISIYPKCCYLYAVICLKQKRKEEALKIAELGIDCLAGNGSLAFLDKLLELCLLCKEDTMRKCQLEAIEFLRKFQTEEDSEEIISKLLYLGTPREVILSSELLKDLRKVQNYSQEQLSANICARETLSKIEQGRLANQKKLQKLLERLGVERETYYSFIVADDFETYEMVREYKRNFFKEENEDAGYLLKEISKRIDLSIPVNKQFVETARIMNDRRKGLLSQEAVIEKLTECLHYTMPEYDGLACRIPYREEMAILNTIALSLKRLKRYDEAIALYESIVQKYTTSKVIQAHHMFSLAILYLNYSSMLEEHNYLEKAEFYGKQGISLMLKQQRGDAAAMLLTNLTCVFEKEETQEGDMLSEQCCRHAYYLLKLFHCEKDCQIVKAYYEEKFYPSISS